MPDLIYLRKSRADMEAEARGEGETLARHEKVLLELARRQGRNVTATYREIVSGETIAARPAMQQLLGEVEQGLWDHVLVMEVERLARGDTIDQGIVAQTFKYAGTKIVTPMKTYDPNDEFDEEYFEFGLFMSRREYKTINRRLQAGRLASVKEGKYVANRPPFGYLRKKLESEKGYTLEPHPDQADIVRLIFGWYTKGEVKPDGTTGRIGVSLIVRRLNELGLKPQRGDVWVNASVRDILQNPVYMGKLRWQRRPANKQMRDGKAVVLRPRATDYTLVDGLHEPIIDEETFLLAQEIMAKNPARPVGDRSKVTNPLAGIVVCGMCGRKMTRRPYSNGQEPSLICPVTSCSNVSVALHYVEDRVLEALDQWLADYRVEWEADLVPLQTPRIHIVKKALKARTEELKGLKSQLNNIHDLLEQGVYSTDRFLERNQVIGERITEAERDIVALEKEVSLEERREVSRKTIIPRVEELLAVYHELPTPAAKNDMLKAVLEKVVYTKTTGGRWHNRPDDFEIVLYPKLPFAGEP